MDGFSTGDILFIVLILGVIHGIMAAIGWQRRRRAKRKGASS